MNSKIAAYLKSLVNLSGDIDYEGTPHAIRKNVAFRGPNVFILAFAIIIASLGLNVNSIPVIIGAMLISPLMGPILGFGFALGTSDNNLMKESLKNFAVMVVISILASTLYFLLSPLKMENPTELLARTNPTIYDVLIALFGGLAGMLENSRHEKGTVISGVAIATALMPPLCTVGYGISIGNLGYATGALYLFIINTIFIALATFFVVKYLRFSPVTEDESGSIRKLKPRTVGIILLIIVVPSIISAVNIVRQTNFNSHASRVVAMNKSIGRGFIYDYKTDHSTKPATLELFMAGEALTESEKEKIYADAEQYGITRPQIVFHESAAFSSDALSESEIVRGIYEYNDRRLSELNDTIASLRSMLVRYENQSLPVYSVSRELFAQYPSLCSLVLTRGSQADLQEGNVPDQIVALVASKERISDEMLERIARWLKVRLSNDNIIVLRDSRPLSVIMSTAEQSASTVSAADEVSPEAGE